MITTAVLLDFIPERQSISANRTDERRNYERRNYEANKEHIRARKRQSYAANRQKEIERCRKYRLQNPEKVKEANERYVSANPEKRAAVINKYISEREKSDPEFKLLRSLRARTRAVLKGKSRGIDTLALLGCSAFDAKAYLETLFQPGMDWNNHGSKGWHIDHKKPLSSFDLNNPIELAKACHYTNLQPLWWQDNLKKGNRNGC